MTSTKAEHLKIKKIMFADKQLRIKTVTKNYKLLKILINHKQKRKKKNNTAKELYIINPKIVFTLFQIKQKIN